jgi:hypothetical protein
MEKVPGTYPSSNGGNERRSQAYARTQPNPNRGHPQSDKGTGARSWRIVGLLLLSVVLAAAAAASFYVATRFWGHPYDGGTPAGANDYGRATTENALVIFSGKATELTAPQGNRISEDRSSPSVVWIASSLKAAKSTGTTAGVYVSVPASLSGELEGQRIRLTVSAARGRAGDLTAPFAIAYSTNGSGNSGWRVFEGAEGFEDYSITYQVPRGAGRGPNYVGIWSDISGRETPLAIRRVTITALP